MAKQKRNDAKVVGTHQDTEDKAQTIRRKTRTGTATGDGNHTVLWIAVLAAASACAAGIFLQKRNRK